jgi:hypothetical protein
MKKAAFRTILVSTALAVVCGFAGCKKKEEAAAGGGSAAATGKAPAAPAEEKPFDVVTITHTGDSPDGSPIFKLESSAKSDVTSMFIDMYAYDESGAQIGKEALSWNGLLKPGATSEATGPKKIEGAKTWEATYHGISFGQGRPIVDDKRNQDQRPKGG